MSLINDALRKARLEAARQETAKHGTHYPGWAGPARATSRPAPLLIVGLVAVLLAGALLFWIGHRSGRGSIGPTDPQAPQQTVAQNLPTPVVERDADEPRTNPGQSAEAPSARTPQPEPAAPAVVRERQPEPRVANTDQPAAETPRQRPQPRPAAAPPAQPSSSPSAVRSSPAADPSSRPRTPAATEPAPDAREATPAAESGQRAEEELAEPGARSFIQQAEIAGVGTLRLGGIAWSEDRPFALINGQVVGPGDNVGILSVVAVEPRHVRLVADDGAVFLLKLP